MAEKIGADIANDMPAGTKEDLTKELQNRMTKFRTENPHLTRKQFAGYIESANDSMTRQIEALQKEAQKTQKTPEKATMKPDNTAMASKREQRIELGEAMKEARGMAMDAIKDMKDQKKYAPVIGKMMTQISEISDKYQRLDNKQIRWVQEAAIASFTTHASDTMIDAFNAEAAKSGNTVFKKFSEGRGRNAAVVTIVLSIGVTKMSKRNAVIRKLTAVETLGCTQVICSDKTGTLTQNKMTVVKHEGSDIKRLVSVMALCSDAEPDENGEAVGEPTECALVNDAQKEGCPKKSLSVQYPRVGEAPFDSMRKRMTTIHRANDGTYFSCTKGAPDEILKRCTSVWRDGRKQPMTEAFRQEILSQNKAMADQALRVLAAAGRAWNQMPSSQEPDFLEQDLCFLGLCGMIDPVRPEVVDAIRECRGAGIRPVMITGDHKDTAVAIAKELGILEAGWKAVTGAEIDQLSDEELDRRIEEYAVYARVQPEHKVRIVDAWKRKGRITAMTGDGVNDAPSIKRADIGIGMGITGTDVTKNVADMVLADDNFATIIAAVEEGRRIYDNIRKAIQFLLASNLAEVLSIFCATLMGFTILNPVHLLWINLITDCFPRS